jgi:GDSL-like Lipase/Acylhydrolase family
MWNSQIKHAWNYVALGDSFTWGFVDLYAGYIEADLGARVTIHNFSVGGQGSDELLKSLREDKSLRALLQTAEVTTFMIPMTYFKEPSIAYINGGDSANQEGMRAAFDLYRRDADGIFMELLSLRKPLEAILRVMDCYLPPFLFWEWKKTGAFEQLKVWWDAFNGHVAQLAAEYHIPLARVREVFNGTSGETNPVEYIGEDGWHTNERGAERIAKLHRELGYAPLIS